jgi:hypothetical protein
LGQNLDADLHIYEPYDEHVYYSNRTALPVILMLMMWMDTDLKTINDNIISVACIDVSIESPMPTFQIVLL